MNKKLLLLAVLFNFYVVHLFYLFTMPAFNTWFLSYGGAGILHYAWLAWTGWILSCLVGTPVLTVSILLESLGTS
jgi:hypothetical protein